MSLDEIVKVLNLHKNEIANCYKVKNIGVFGSYAKHENTAASDIDILVDFTTPVGWEFLDLKEYLENLLELEVDLVTPNALKKQMKESVISSTVFIK